MKKLFIAAVTLGMAIGSYAQTAGGGSMAAPVKKYHASAGITAFSCELMGSTFLMTLNSADNPDKCIESARQTAGDEFKTAAGALSGKPLDALKDFHIAHLAYLNALAPDLRERGQSYKARLRMAKAKADEMWTRLEMEIQLGS
jgi:hypothetical protein